MNAQLRLGEMCEWATGGVPKDARGVEVVHAQISDLVAQMRLGFVHYRGDRVPKDTKKAAKWFAARPLQGAGANTTGAYPRTRGVHQNQ